MLALAYLTFIHELIGFETLLYPDCNVKAGEINEKKTKETRVKEDDGGEIKKVLVWADSKPKIIKPKIQQKQWRTFATSWPASK